MGDQNDKPKRGIIPRALEHIFETAQRDRKYSYEIKVAYLQIYMEMVSFKDSLSLKFVAARPY